MWHIVRDKNHQIPYHVQMKACKYWYFVELVLSYLDGNEQSGGGMDEGTLFFISHWRTGLMAHVQFQGFPYKSIPCRLNKENGIFIKFSWQAGIQSYVKYVYHWTISIILYLLWSGSKVLGYNVFIRFWSSLSHLKFLSPEKACDSTISMPHKLSSVWSKIFENQF